jgi:hypothetical protein
MRSEPPTNVAARLRHLEDRTDITDVINRYGDGIRLNDPTLIASCFTDHASVDFGHGEAPIVGRDEIHKYFAQLNDSSVIRSIQNFDRKIMSTPVMSNVVIALKGDTAICESSCIAIHVGYKGEEGRIIVRGTHNVDDFVRSDEWRIHHRAHSSLWVFEVTGTPLLEIA